MSKTLRLILGDQLNSNHSWFKKIDANISYVMMEIYPEATYIRHHIQKIIGFFAAMRNFAQELKEQGHHIIYFRLDDLQNSQSFQKNIESLLRDAQYETFEYQEADEFRLDQLFRSLSEKIPIKVKVYDSEHFLTQREELKILFPDKKYLRMESFYRKIRKKYNILMDGNKPLADRWNFDTENRKKLPAKFEIAKPFLFNHDVSKIYNLIIGKRIPTIGTVNPKHFIWPISRHEALMSLKNFLEQRLENFGTYQDAMYTDHPFLFHSYISFALNIKMIGPLEVVQQAIAYWQENQNRIGLAQIEGFIRQIIGWREYMRGVYWAYMPEYQAQNFFNHRNSLPDFYWTGKTKMNCLKYAIKQSLEIAYAHHIQRLMITGNFALLSGIDPDAVDDWYLGIYMDAIQWVEITNTRGMSQFADGGMVGTKPYVSSANYIHKMSNYCDQCPYDHHKRYGDKACPFNSLYWHFFDRNRELLQKNPRLGMVYRLLDKIPVNELEKINSQAKHYLQQINHL